MTSLEQFLKSEKLEHLEIPSAVILRDGMPPDKITGFCTQAKNEMDASLALLTAIDNFPSNERFEIITVLHIPGDSRFLIARTPLPDGKTSFPTLARLFPNANWPEREIHDMFGLTPQDHPDPRPLVWKGAWPRDAFPLRKDFVSDRSYQIQRVLHPVTKVEGEGVFEIPVGPIHAGIIEPGHFRFQAVGDTILGLDAQLFFCHRGIEKLAEGKTPYDAVLLAERQCGTCSVSNTLSFCLAVERAAGADVPARARMLRVFFLELERLYNHVNDVAAIAAGVGFAFLTQQGLRIKEEMQRYNAALCGHRFLRNIFSPGGMRQDFDYKTLRDLDERLKALCVDLLAAVDIALNHSIFLDRLETTGVLTYKNAKALRAVGPPARASGIIADTRVDHPHDGYNEIPKFDISHQKNGDVMARFQLRLDEIKVSSDIITEVLKTLPSGPVRNSIGLHADGAWGLGATESPRGENLCLLRFGNAGKIDRYAVRTASYCNWPCIPTTVRGNIVPDFPLINKSFELCYADVDR